MKTVLVPPIKENSLRAVLESVYGTFKGFVDEPVIFDLSQLPKAYPLLVSALAGHIQKYNSQVINASPEVQQYFSRISFPQGIDDISNLKPLVNQNTENIPIGVLHKSNEQGREHLEKLFIDLILKRLATQVEGLRNGIQYPVAELITNIMEHSHSSGLIFGQYYSDKEYLDICLLDTGRGLAGTYRDEKKLELSDEEALEEALKGHSTKAIKERGYGLRTSKKLVCQGMQGEFVLLSGTCFHFSDQRGEYLISLPDFYWQGVIVAYRIPKPVQRIDIYKFVE